MPPLYQDWTKGNPSYGYFYAPSLGYQYFGWWTLPLNCIAIRGEWEKKVVFQKVKSKTVARRYPGGRVWGNGWPNEPTSKQLQWTGKFSAGCKAWWALSEQQREQYRQIVKKKRLAQYGFNYFLSLYLRDKI